VALRRIQELTAAGVNLEGVKRIMALEVELASRKEEMADIASEAKSNIEEAHRQYRRDLVPVQNAIELLIDARRRARGGS
jgi:MerR family transcriptional regulator/heat shock protein HspR